MNSDLLAEKKASIPLTAFPVWDRTTRWFHWINVACVVVLAALGLAILNEDAFGFSREGIILLKTLHVYTGYVFALNLIWRIIWAFAGNAYARWKALLPFRAGYLTALGQYAGSFFSGKAPEYLGHSPPGRLVITLMLILLIAQAGTGLVIAGTDLYKPPFGNAMAHWVTGGDEAKLANLKPGSKEFVDPKGYEEMRAFRKPFKELHEYVFYLLMVVVTLHVIGILVAEIRHRHGLISAMITGRKVFSGLPIDDVREATNDQSKSPE